MVLIVLIVFTVCYFLFPHSQKPHLIFQRACPLQENSLAWFTLSTNSKSSETFLFFAKQSLEKIDNASAIQMKFILNLPWEKKTFHFSPMYCRLFIQLDWFARSLLLHLCFFMIMIIIVFITLNRILCSCRHTEERKETYQWVF